MRSRRRILLYSPCLSLCVCVCLWNAPVWFTDTQPQCRRTKPLRRTNTQSINIIDHFPMIKTFKLFVSKLTPRSTNMHISTHITRREWAAISLELLTNLRRFMCILNRISFTSAKVAFWFSFLLYLPKTTTTTKKLRMFWTCSNDGDIHTEAISGFRWISTQTFGITRTILRILKTFIASVNAFERPLFRSHTILRLNIERENEEQSVSYGDKISRQFLIQWIHHFPNEYAKSSKIFSLFTREWNSFITGLIMSHNQRVESFMNLLCDLSSIRHYCVSLILYTKIEHNRRTNFILSSKLWFRRSETDGWRFLALSFLS